MYIQSHLILFSLLFCIQSHIPCRKTSFGKYCHAADLIIKLNQENVKYKNTKHKITENRLLNSNKNILEKTEK